MSISFGLPYNPVKHFELDSIGLEEAEYKVGESYHNFRVDMFQITDGPMQLKEEA